MIECLIECLIECMHCRRGGVMVSTDAAARGIDIPNVTHVIQADFAASAVDFLHRVGLQSCMQSMHKPTCFQSVWCQVCISIRVDL